MKYNIKLELLSAQNIDIMNKLLFSLCKNNLHEYDETLFIDLIAGKYAEFYPIMEYNLIKINDEPNGLVGYYNSFLFKKDLWIDRIKLNEEYNKEAFISNTLKLLEHKIKNEYPEISHIRKYYSLDKDSHDIEIFKSCDYHIGNRKYGKDDVRDYIVLSKNIKNEEYEEWVRKPVW